MCDVCYEVMYVDCNTSLANSSWVFSLYEIDWDIDIPVRNFNIYSSFRNTKQIVVQCWLVMEYTQIRDYVQMVSNLVFYAQSTSTIISGRYTFC